MAFASLKNNIKIKNSGSKAFFVSALNVCRWKSETTGERARGKETRQFIKWIVFEQS